MKWPGFPILIACVVCLSCSDGGPVGTGISVSAISGNVVDVQADAAAARVAPTAAGLPPIRISVDGLPSVATMADRSGNFVLRGRFDGAVTVRFAVPQFQVTQQLDVPAGSTVVLQDIELQPDGVVAQAARQLEFFGSVDLVDCSDGTLLVHERRPDGTQFLVHLDAQTSFADTEGRSASCDAVREGSTVGVQGSIAYAGDRTITALVVTLGPVEAPPPQSRLEARFVGAIAALDCSAGYIVVADAQQRSAVQLTSRTLLTRGSSPLACADLQLGEPVRGDGQINLRMPGVIVATALTVTGPPTGGQPLRLAGVVAALDCVDGLLQIQDDRTTVEVQLSAATVITRRDGQAATCADIEPGDRVQGLGRVVPDGSGTLQAVQLTVRPGGPGQMHGGAF
jgi:hypothetical protein